MGSIIKLIPVAAYSFGFYYPRPPGLIKRKTLRVRKLRVYALLSE
jgi:hypothetical protein